MGNDLYYVPVSYSLGDEISNVEITEGEMPVPYDIPSIIDSLSFSFELFGKSSEKATLIIFGIWDVVVEGCSNKRVRHLAKHARKEKTRKKNVHRAFRMVERR